MTLADIEGMAHELALSYASTELSYRKLVQAVHDTRDQFNPKQIRQSLSVYLTKSRISEIMRIAYTNDKIYTDYMTKLCGFRAALKKTRAIREKELRAQRWCAEFDRLQPDLSQIVYRSGDKVLIVLVEKTKISRILGDITISAKYDKTSID